ncbi:PKD domain-containing protein, partial [Natronomonas sp.]|uniref:PKD domain-containing protein n=1 Tax=Natronomonas sp. TaxID=2184060 RepID=UPI002FC39AF6
MADAGLDQSVSVNTTVQLDATGSIHPDGEIERYEWRIETPNGRVIEPECVDCARTTFSPDTAGRYEVAVTVTGSEGETASDTLYVDVEGIPDDSRDTTETPDRSAGFDSSGSDTANEGREHTTELDGNKVGGSIFEIDYETPIEINECNTASGVGTGYTTGGNFDDC